MHELIEARDEKRLLRLQRQLAGHKLLIVDELGYVPLSQTGAELLFEVFSQRYERGSTIVTSNLPFDEWTSVSDANQKHRRSRPQQPEIHWHDSAHRGAKMIALCARLPSSPGLAGAAKDRSRWIRPVTHFYSGKSMHFHSGVDKLPVVAQDQANSGPRKPIRGYG